MHCMQSYGGHVQDLWWMFHSQERECFTFHRVTWNKYLPLLFFHLTNILSLLLFILALNYFLSYDVIIFLLEFFH